MKFLIGFLVSIGLLIVVFVLIFRGGSHNGSQSGEQAKPLSDYASTSTVMQLTEQGPVTANMTHPVVRITVGNVETSMEVFQGYQYHLIDSHTYPNNSIAYADFLNALDRAGFTKGDTDISLKSEVGACASGNRYNMTILQGSKTIQNFWTSTCGKKSGSFRGSYASVRSLFEAQVPGYDEIYSNLTDQIDNDVDADQSAASTPEN